MRYCMNCGMPIPRKAKICPECGFTLNRLAPKNDARQSAPAQFSREQPDPLTTQRERRLPRSKQKTNRFLAAAVIAVFGAALFCIILAAGALRNARSRHRENMMDAKRSAEEKAHPEISIPDIQMPEFSFPEIHLPEPPAAAFAVESYEIETNLMGETVLYVNVSYTNKAENEQCFLTSFQISVQQEGEACRQTAGTPTRENHLTDAVQPDETALVSEAFIISTEKETTVSVGAFLGGNKYLEETVIPHADGTVSAAE